MYNLESGVPVIDENQSNKFVFRENTQAVFIDANKELSEKWEVKAGLRLENTHTKGKLITNGQENTIQYTKLFPTAYVNYKLNENNTFSLNYGKRISRPSFEMLNPFRTVMSPYAYAEGNPYLKPSYSHNIELEYGYKDMLTTSVYYSDSKGIFEQLGIMDPVTNIQEYKPLNFINNKMLGVSQYVTIEPFQWLKTYFTADIYYSEARSSIPVTLQFLKGWSGEFRVNSDFILNKDKTALFGINYFLNTRGVDNLDTNTDHGQLNATLKLFFMQKKLQFALSGNDILSSNRAVYEGYTNNVKAAYKNYWDIRSFRLSLTYNFGSDLKNTGERENKNAAEQNRVQ